MSKKAKIMRWAGAALSLPASIYAGTSFIFYAWLNAADPERWPAEKAAIWAYSSLVIAILFLGVFIFCVASLIKEANRKYREEQRT
ncbi:MAG: hypothetical protein KJO91_07575 [Gammaproteobacteria bacterium]|nr:hypothetical protein [Gammaproteobacteria bacterium]